MIKMCLYCNKNPVAPGKSKFCSVICQMLNRQHNNEKYKNYLREYSQKYYREVIKPKKQLDKDKFTKRICVVCGDEFFRRKRDKKLVCSEECAKEKNKRYSNRYYHKNKILLKKKERIY